MFDPSSPWQVALGALGLLLGLAVAGHAVLFKRDVRAALGWAAVVLMFPFGGAALYLLLGINRIRRRGAALTAGRVRYRTMVRSVTVTPDDLEARFGPRHRHLASLARFVDATVSTPLLRGNRVRAFDRGTDAYDAMIAAIDGARRSVGLVTYIFGNDPVGLRFRDALARACERGVAVRVLIDAVGSRYSWPPMIGELRAAGVPTAPFMPTRLPWRLPYLNLRNHRKLLLIDGRCAFTGGMNLSPGHVSEGRDAIQDLHFQLNGPVVASLRQAFAEDWTFTSGERLDGDPWFPSLVAGTADTQPIGPTVARVILDSPGEHFEHLRWTLLGALSCAQRSVRILTPYFLPDAGLTTALTVAARRGVEIDIVLPARGNLRLVQWATEAFLWQVLEGGCRVWLGAPPFDHSKLVLVDDAWVLLGSANWDDRSLRLNFELNVECYDPHLAAQLDTVVTAKLARARRLTLAEVDARPLPIRLRDSLARLLTPYL